MRAPSSSAPARAASSPEQGYQRGHGASVTGRAGPSPNQAIPSETRSIVRKAAPAGGGPAVTVTVTVSPGPTARGSALRGPSQTRTRPAASAQCTPTFTGAAPVVVHVAMPVFLMATGTLGSERETVSGPPGMAARVSKATRRSVSPVATPIELNQA